MALFRWRGVQSGAWNDGRNWVDGADAVYAVGRYPGSVQGTFDDVECDQALATGANSIAGYDGSGDESLLSFKVSGNFDGNIGSAASPLIIDIAGGGGALAECVLETSKTIYLQSGAKGIFNAVVLDGETHLSGNIVNLSVYRGNVYIEGASVLVSLFVGRMNSLVDAYMSIASTVTLSGTTHVTGGRVECAADIGGMGLVMTDGYWTQSASVINEMWIYGGTFKWASGDITTAFVYGGKFDGSESNTKRTIRYGFVYSGGTLNLDNGIGNIVIGDYIQSFGGTIIWPRGKRLRYY